MHDWIQALFIIGVFSLTILFFFTDTSEQDIANLRNAIVSQRQANRAMRREIKQLQDEIYRITHDDRYLEQLSRNTLALSRPGEELYLFQDQKKGPFKPLFNESK